MRVDAKGIQTRGHMPEHVTRRSQYLYFLFVLLCQKSPSTSKLQNFHMERSEGIQQVLAYLTKVCEIYDVFISLLDYRR